MPGEFKLVRFKVGGNMFCFVCWGVLQKLSAQSRVDFEAGCFLKGEGGKRRLPGTFILKNTGENI